MQQPGNEVPAAPQDAYGQALPGNFQRVGRVLNALGTVWIIALMVLINSDVLGRNLFKAPVRGVTELVALSIVGIVFLQLADTLHSGRFTRADVLLDRLKRRRPVFAARLQALFHLVGAALMGVILWAAWQPLVESIEQRYLFNGVNGGCPTKHRRLGLLNNPSLAEPSFDPFQFSG